MNEKRKQSFSPEDPFPWEEVVPFPMLVGACICIFFALLPLYANRENFIPISLWANNDNLVLSCVGLSIQGRSILWLLAALCILPHALLARKQFAPHWAEGWAKLGLIFGIAMLFVGFTAAPEFYSEDSVWVSPWAAIGIFDLTLEDESLISAQLQSRMLLTSLHSILLPLLLCLIVQITQWRRVRKIRTLVEIHLIVISLMIFGTNAAVYSDYHGIYYAIISIVLLCWDHLRAKSQYVPQAHDLKEEGNSLLIHGIALLVLYGCTLIMFVLVALGIYERGEDFSSYGIAVSWILCLWLVLVLLAAKNRTIAGTVLPLYLLCWAGFVCTFFLHLCLNPDSFRVTINPVYPDTFEPILSLKDRASTWAFTCVASTLYAIYFLYDYGLKRRPWVIAGVTALLIVSMHIPEYEFVPETCVTLCALRNLLLGAIAPILVIAVGTSSGLTHE